MFIDKNGDIYQGDMQLGDREATEAEIETHEASIVTALKIAEAKAYLASTDYIVTKIAEAQALGEDTTLLLSQYAVELQQRKEARAFVGANS